MIHRIIDVETGEYCLIEEDMSTDEWILLADELNKIGKVIHTI